jgi:FkbM family methyltransferase
MSIYSGKDDLIQEIFYDHDEKFFIDVGAHDGISGSHTYTLESLHGWSGICIEAHPTLFSRLSRCRETTYQGAIFSKKEELEIYFQDIPDENENVKAGHAFGGGSGITNRWNEHHKNTIMDQHPGKGCTVSVETETLSEIMNKFDCPEYIHLLDIDVEYADYDVLIGCDWDKHRFGGILIELNNELVEDKMKKEGYNTYIQFIEDSGDRMYIDSENKALEKSVKELAKSKLAPNKEFWQIESLI